MMYPRQSRAPKYRRLVFIPRFSFCEEEEEEVIPSGQLACKAQSRGRAPAGVSLLNRLILPVPWKILIGASGRGNGPAAPFKWLRRAVGYSWLKEAARCPQKTSSALSWIEHLRR